MENFHWKRKFYNKYRKFWVVQNSDPVIKKLDKINSNKKARNISTFDFRTMYTAPPHAVTALKFNGCSIFIHDMMCLNDGLEI